MDEVETLKLHTLRMLLRSASQPLVIVDDTTNDAEIELLARAYNAPLVVILDHDDRALLGTVSPRPMKVISMLAEEEVDATARRIVADDINYVLVSEGNGHVLGVLSANDVTSHRRAA
jgi:hypothetical protein